MSDPPEIRSPKFTMVCPEVWGILEALTWIESMITFQNII
jgi:hypothetical protein